MSNRSNHVELSINSPIHEVVSVLDLSDARRQWVQEPPFILRGVVYYKGTRTVYLYISEDDPLYRQFNDNCQWDYTTVAECRVGGIVYVDGEHRIEVGPDVPWQFRRPQ